MFSIVGIILIAFGVIALIYGGVNFIFGKNIVNKGSMQVRADQQRQIPLSTIASAAESCSLKEPLTVTISWV